MGLWATLKKWLRQLAGKDLPKAVVIESKRVPEWKLKTIPKAGYQATRQDISKWMKHGRQSKYYRATVKAKKQPDED